MLRGFVCVCECVCVWGGGGCVLVTEVRENVLWAEILMKTYDFFVSEQKQTFNAYFANEQLSVTLFRCFEKSPLNVLLYIEFRTDALSCYEFRVFPFVYKMVT